MRNYADRELECVINPEISQEFDSLAEAYDSYDLYSWETGFGIKYGQCQRNIQGCKTVFSELGLILAACLQICSSR